MKREICTWAIPASFLTASFIIVLVAGCDSDQGQDECPAPQPHEEYCIPRYLWECDYTRSYCRDGEWHCSDGRMHPPAPPDFEDWAWRCELFVCDAWTIPMDPPVDWPEPDPYEPPDPATLTGDWQNVADSDDIVPAGCERQRQQYADGRSLAVDRSNPDIMYVGFNIADHYPSNTVSGVFKSFDGGTSWLEARTALGSEGCYGAECTYGPDVEMLYVDPDDSDVVFASTTERGLYRTSDGARTWHFVDLPIKCIYMGPVGKGFNGAYYAACFNAIFTSHDLGVTWREIQSLGELGRPVSALGFDQQMPNRVWAGMCRGAYPDTGEGYLFLSDDAGESWTEMGFDIDNECKGYGCIWSIDICDSNPSQMAVTVYLSGLFFSEDGGVSWRRASSPMDGHYMFTAEYQPSSEGCRLFASDGTAFLTQWTEDAGRTWTEETDRALDHLFFNPFVPDIIAGLNIQRRPYDRDFELWKRE